MKRWYLLLGCCVAVFTLLGCSLEEVYLSFYLDGQAEALVAPAGLSDDPITFVVNSGDSVALIAAGLKAEGLISDTELFRRYVQSQGLDAGIQAGTYTLRQTMTIPEIAQALQYAEAPDQQVTIPEGKRLEEVAVLVAQQTDIASDAFLVLAQTGWRDTDLSARYPFLVHLPESATLEGFLSPDTYRLPQQATPYDLVDRMLQDFQSQLTSEVQQGFADHGLSLYEGITLASIVEREAVLADERPLIAGVYYNRLRDGWFLSACPTVQYALGYRAEEGTWWKRQIYFVDLEVASAYNTYRNVGLPPGPIASPGGDAIVAAAHPAETDFFFFMVDCTRNDGGHFFSRTETEHLAHFNACGGVYNTNP